MSTRNQSYFSRSSLKNSRDKLWLIAVWGNATWRTVLIQEPQDVCSCMWKNNLNLNKLNGHFNYVRHLLNICLFKSTCFPLSPLSYMHLLICRQSQQTHTRHLLCTKTCCLPPRAINLSNTFRNRTPNSCVPQTFLLGLLLSYIIISMKLSYLFPHTFS